MPNSSQNYLLGRKHLSNNYRSVSGGHKHKNLIRSKDRKKAIREFNKEVQSAVLPEIASALTSAKGKTFGINHRNASNEMQDRCNNIDLNNQQDRKYIEYIHEEIYDEKRKGKWTIFNKHAVVVEREPEPLERSARGYLCKEDSIIESLNNQNRSSISDNVWNQLYEAKCMDLGLPCKSDKQQERFVTQMTLTQRDDRLSFRDQGMGYQSANIIGKTLIGNNDKLRKIDLSCNQFQCNFKPIVNGIRKNKRLIQLIMKNNQLSGAEHAQDLKAIVKNHPSLYSIDFSNSEMNVNKNKLRNTGAAAIVEGILESSITGHCLLGEINLSYNYLTSDCLYCFAQLNDQNFIRIQQLNLSYNALGPESFKILGPMLGSVVTLNLSNTKLTNQSITDFIELYSIQKMNLKELDIHSNQITAEGFHDLISCLQSNNKVSKLYMQKNNLGNDIDKFKMIHTFLSCNKTMELLDLSFCDLNESCAVAIGKGLRGNRFLQSLSLKGNPIKSGVIEIAKAFQQNTVALCLKELDISKCQLTCKHITHEFLNMIRSPFTTLNSLSIRDNLIKYRGSELIRDALEDNKTIVKLQIDYNPIKQEVAEQIEKICLRNKELDEINQKNKNLYELMYKKMNAKTQRQCLKKEIKDLKDQTDKTIQLAQNKLSEVERLQRCRNTSKSFFVTVVPGRTSGTGTQTTSQCGDIQSRLQEPNTTRNQIQIQPGSSLAYPKHYKEPQTSLTRESAFTFASQGTCVSMVQHNRHKSQGPMRSEKVYMMTQMIDQKCEQLAAEKCLVKAKFENIDEEVTEQKEEILGQYRELVEDRDFIDAEIEEKDKTIKDLEDQEKEIKAKYEKMIEDMQDRIKVLKLAQQDCSEKLK